MRVSLALPIAFACLVAGRPSGPSGPSIPSTKVVTCQEGSFLWIKRNICLPIGGPLGVSNDKSEDCPTDWYFHYKIKKCAPKFAKSMDDPCAGWWLDPLRLFCKIKCKLTVCISTQAGVDNPPKQPAGCPKNMKLDITSNTCVIISSPGTPSQPSGCPPNMRLDITSNTCVIISSPGTPSQPSGCPPNMRLDITSNTCVIISSPGTPSQPGCPQNMRFDISSNVCVIINSPGAPPQPVTCPPNTRLDLMTYKCISIINSSTVSVVVHKPQHSQRSTRAPKRLVKRQDLVSCGDEFVDPNSLKTCGGCVGVQGQDCTAIPHVGSVSCERKRCIVHTCKPGSVKVDDATCSGP